MSEGADGKLYAPALPGLIRVDPDGNILAVPHKMNGDLFAPALVLGGDAVHGITTAGGKRGGIVDRDGLGSGGSQPAPTIVIQDVPPTPLESRFQLL